MIELIHYTMENGKDFLKVTKPQGISMVDEKEQDLETNPQV